jgi:hypothetical protein
MRCRIAHVIHAVIADEVRWAALAGQKEPRDILTEHSQTQ